jgi:hypothetical protein
MVENNNNFPQLSEVMPMPKLPSIPQISDLYAIDNVHLRDKKLSLLET